MKRGEKVSLESKREIVESVNRLLETGVGGRKACKDNGLTYETYRRYRHQIGSNGNEPEEPKEEGSTVTTMFQVVDAKKSRDWVTYKPHGRFTELKESLIQSVRGLRRTESIHFPAPEQTKELKAMVHACRSALVNSGQKDWYVRYSVTRKVIVVIHLSQLRANSNGGEE